MLSREQRLALRILPQSTQCWNLPSSTPVDADRILRDEWSTADPYDDTVIFNQNLVDFEPDYDEFQDIDNELTGLTIIEPEEAEAFFEGFYTN